MLKQFGDMLKGYYEQYIPQKLQKPLGIGIIILLVIYTPFFVRGMEKNSGGDLSLLFSVNVALIYVTLALGLNIVVGFAGLLDLGYAAFFALGAYTFGILTGPMHGIEMPFFIALLFVAPVAAIFGIIIGTPTLRLRGDYLAIVTLAFGEIVPNALRNFSDIHIPWLGLDHFNLTNGTQGLKPIGRPVLPLSWFGGEDYSIGSGIPLKIGDLEMNSQMMWFYMTVAIGFVVLVGSQRLNNSRLGRAWKAIREDETAADCMGVNPVSTKLLAFAIGASFSGLAGGVFASMSQAVFPELFFFNVSIFILIIVIISGMGNVWGVLVGGVIITLFDRVFLAQIADRMLNDLAASSVSVRIIVWVFFGAALVTLLILSIMYIFNVNRKRGIVWGVTGSGVITIFMIYQIISSERLSKFILVIQQFLAGIDLPLYRWVMFGTGLLIIMLIQPEGLFPPKARTATVHIEVEEYLEHKQMLTQAEGGAD